MKDYPFPESKSNINTPEAIDIINKIVDKFGYLHVEEKNIIRSVYSETLNNNSWELFEENSPFSKYYINVTKDVSESEFFMQFTFYDNKISFRICNPLIQQDVTENITLLSFSEIKNIIREYLPAEINKYYSQADFDEYYILEMKLALVNDVDMCCIVPAWQIYSSTRNYGADHAEIMRINAIDGSIMNLNDRMAYDPYMDALHKK